MSNSTGAETPLQEAISMITIISILTSVGCYVAVLNQVPVITPALWWVACRVYEFLPVLAGLPVHRCRFWRQAQGWASCSLFTIPLSYWLAGVFAWAGYASMERQTTQLKRFREKRKNSKRDHDGFSIG